MERPIIEAVARADLWLCTQWPWIPGAVVVCAVTAWLTLATARRFAEFWRFQRRSMTR